MYYQILYTLGRKNGIALLPADSSEQAIEKLRKSHEGEQDTLIVQSITIKKDH